MKIQYLGTGGAEGFPSVFCKCEACRKVRKIKGKNVKTRSCTLVNDVLIDLSPDIFLQCVNYNIDLSEVRNLVVTHSHTDHLNTTEICFRLRELASVIEEKDKKTFNIYGNDEVYSVIIDMLRRDYHIDMSRLEYHKIKKFEEFFVNGLKFIPLKANHKLDEDAFIFIVDDGRSSLLYANDTGAFAEETLEFIKKQRYQFDLVSMDTCRGTLPGDSHMGIKENLELRQMLMEYGLVNSDTKCYLNHFSHMCGLLPLEYEKLVEQYGFKLTYDGLLLNI